MAVNTSSVQSMKFTRHLIRNSSPGVTVVVLHMPSVEHYHHHHFLPSTSLWHGLDLQREWLCISYFYIPNFSGVELGPRYPVYDQCAEAIQEFPLGYPPPIIPTLLAVLNCHQLTSLIPKPPRPTFAACSTKSGEQGWTDLSCDACCC